MTGKSLLEIMVKDGVYVSEEERDKVAQDLQTAVDGDNFIVIKYKNKPIGFATYVDKASRVLINYCFVYKVFRDRFSLLSLRKYFREKFNKRFSWKSRRRNKICSVK